MVQSESIYLVKGIGSSDRWFWELFWDRKKDYCPSVHFSVTASSKKALPSNAEMGRIAALAPSVFFAPGIYNEVKHPSFTGEEFDVTPIIDGKQPRSIIFLDESITRVRYHSGLVDVHSGGGVELVILSRSIKGIIHHDAKIYELAEAGGV